MLGDIILLYRRHFGSAKKFLAITSLALVLGISLFVSGVVYIQLEEDRFFKGHMTNSPEFEYDLRVTAITNPEQTNLTTGLSYLDERVNTVLEELDLSPVVVTKVSRLTYPGLEWTENKTNTPTEKPVIRPIIFVELTTELEEALMSDSLPGSYLPRRSNEVFILPSHGYEELSNNQTIFILQQRLGFELSINLTVTGIRTKLLPPIKGMSHPIVFPLQPDPNVLIAFVPSLNELRENVKTVYSQDSGSLLEIRYDCYVDLNFSALSVAQSERFTEYSWSLFLNDLALGFTKTSEKPPKVYLELLSSWYIEDSLKVKQEMLSIQLLLSMPVLVVILFIFHYALAHTYGPIKQNFKLYYRKGMAPEFVTTFILLDGLIIVVVANLLGFLLGSFVALVLVEPSMRQANMLFNSLNDILGLQTILSVTIFLPLVMWQLKQQIALPQEDKRTTSKITQSFWQRHYLDLMAFLVGVVGVTLMTLFNDRSFLDNYPMTLFFIFFSSLLVLGFFSTISRFVPLITKGLVKLCSSTTVGVYSVSVRLIQRHHGSVIRITTLVILVFSMAMVYMVTPISATSWFEEETFQEVGGEAAIYFQWHTATYDNSVMSDTPFINKLKENFTYIDDNISPFVMFSSSGRTEMTIFAIDTQTFTSVAFNPPKPHKYGMLPSEVAKLKEKQPMIPVLVLNEFSYGTGDEIAIDDLNTTCKVVGMYDVFPRISRTVTSRVELVMDLSRMTEAIVDNPLDLGIKTSGFYFKTNRTLTSGEMESFSSFVSNYGYRAEFSSEVTKKKLQSPALQIVFFQVRLVSGLFLLLFAILSLLKLYQFFADQRYYYWMLRALGLGKEQQFGEIILYLSFVMVVGIVLGDIMFLMLLFLVKVFLIGNTRPNFSWVIPIDLLLISHILCCLLIIVEALLMSMTLTNKNKTYSVLIWD